MIKRSTKLLLKVAGVAVLAATGVLKVPSLHSGWLQKSVGNEVVLLTNARGGGGTGWVADLGDKKVTITNKHVCASSGKDGTLVGSSGSESVVLKIIKVSDRYDLCALEAFPERDGLTVTSDPDVGDSINIVGHPHLYPLIVSRGVVVRKNYIIDLATKIVEYPNECDGGKAFLTLFGWLCIESHTSTFIDAQGYPGNSGSPVVDDLGRVIGVLFAGDNSTNYSFLVPAYAVKEFMESLK